MNSENKLIQIARKNIQMLTPYQSARRIGGNGDVWLNANESPEMTCFSCDFDNLNRYPEPQPEAILKSYADYAGIKSEQIIITRGADEAIELLMRAFCELNQDKIIFCPPTYGMYNVSADTLGISYTAIPTINHWQLDLPAIIENLADNLEKTKLIYICRPNNPTGNLIDPDDIKKLLEITANKTLVVVDEAYIEFAEQESLIGWLKEYDNLVILRTLSKAFSLAGIRCGFAIANKSVINTLSKVIAPYPIPTPVADIAAQALSEQGIAKMRLRVANLNRQKELFSQALNKLEIVDTVYSSFGNYVLVKFNINDVFKQFSQQGIVLRDQDKQLGLKNCIRITIGTQSECEKVLNALIKINDCNNR